jgi:hypothetical protein
MDNRGRIERLNQQFDSEVNGTIDRQAELPKDANEKVEQEGHKV